MGYDLMMNCLQLKNQRTRCLGPIGREFKTFHINEGVTHDQVVRMSERLESAKQDLRREQWSIQSVLEKRERTNDDMSQDEVTGAVEMMRKWRDGRGSAVAKEIRAEAYKYFCMDDGIEAGRLTWEQMQD